MKKKQNRLPYNAEARNRHFGIRRGNPWRLTPKGKWKATGEHPSEVHPTGKKER